MKNIVERGNLMAIKKLIVRFIDDNGNYEEEEIYEVMGLKEDPDFGFISSEAEIVQVSKNQYEGSIVSLENGERFLLVSKEEEYSLEELTESPYVLNKLSEEKIISIGNNLPSIIADSIRIPDNIDELINKVIDIKLTRDNINDCIELLRKFPIRVDDLIDNLEIIQSKYGSIDVKDIQNTKLLNELSGLFRDFKMYRKAKVLLERSLDINEKNPVTNTRMGTVCKLMGNYTDGILYYNTSNTYKESSYSYIGLGALYRDLNELLEAEKCYLKSFQFENNNQHKHAHRGIGAVYFDMGRYDEGKKHFRLGDVNIGYLFNWYKEAEHNYEDEKAIEILRLILEIDPNHRVAKYNLVRLED